jgi:RNA-directed DNA polymerase
MLPDFFDDSSLYIWEFKNKNYPHFDGEFCQKRVETLLQAIVLDKPIAHTFYPLIRFEIPKFKKDENARVYKDKDNPRYIMHTARVDANVYSFYRNVLMNNYESTLKKLELNDCVIAYRKIPIGVNSSKGKCNVHFANEVIEEIKKQTEAVGQCAAIAMDISGFFDNLDHRIIKRQWCRVMGFENGLPASHFTVFKNITKFRYIEADKLEQVLDFKFRGLKKKQICTPDIFRKQVVPHISKENKRGIPQGTTISDVIANMYMLDFDSWMKKFSDKYKGYYRRYSDDILLICPVAFQEKAIKFISWLIKRTALSISDKKTLIANFKKTGKGIECASYKNNNGRFELINKPFEYLGLSFDGVHTRIRQSTISGFHEKLSQRIKKEVNIAYRKLTLKGNPCPDKNEIYKIVSFNMIRNSYMENREESDDDDFHGNFYTYVDLVAKVTSNESVRDVFKSLGKWIKKRAWGYCEKKMKRYKQ